MKVIEYEKCTLHLVEYRNKSMLGNPSYWVCFTDSNGKFHHGYTMSNSSAGYEIKTGQCVIDCIKHNASTEVKNQNLFYIRYNRQLREVFMTNYETQVINLDNRM